IMYGGSAPEGVPQEHRLVQDLIGLTRKRMGGRLQWLVRLHPNDNGSRWGEVANLPDVVLYRTNTSETKRHWIPDNNQLLDLIAQLLASAVVVNNASTLTFDACVLDRPVVCVRFEPGSRKLSRSIKIFEM